MRHRLVMLTGLLLMAISSSLVGSAWGAETKELRVCGDPDNLPFSNKKREGFENKIAEVIAKELGAELTYFWWPHQRGLIRSTLKAGQCDVLISVPHGWEPVLWTKPYYRSGYVIVYPKDRGLKITSLNDPILKQLKIGVYINSPPAEALAENGIVKNVVGYNLLYDYRQDRPGKIIEDLIAGEIGVAVVWGPVAGHYTRKLNASHLEIVPLQGGGSSTPFTFEFSMGVREGNKALKVQLEEALSKRQAEIQKILEDYGVPLLPLLAKGQFGPVKDQPGQIIYHRD
ncbi:MAG TPA: substrate-binding domain-containing protein [Candidatus Methylomirabilis sp.]|nr:substrate-binding domain-containing protein [Candidatus Methylomirabilis sp.]